MSSVVSHQELLDDARLVLEYAIRVGRLPDDTLPNAIEAFQSASPEHHVQYVRPLSLAAQCCHHSDFANDSSRAS